MIQQYLAIQFADYGTTKVKRSLVSKRSSNPESMYWSGGPSHCNWPKSFEILKDYGLIDDNDDFDIWLQYVKDFPPMPVDMNKIDYKAVCGWLSPEGVLYDCESTGHTGLADNLCIVLYNVDDRYRPDEHLRSRGWLRISDVGLLSGKDRIEDHWYITSSQDARLRGLALVNRDSIYAKNIEWCMKNYHIQDFDA